MMSTQITRVQKSEVKNPKKQSALIPKDQSRLKSFEIYPASIYAGRLLILPVRALGDDARVRIGRPKYQSARRSRVRIQDSRL